MPRTGRPIKGSERKDKSLQLRLGQSTIDKIQECADYYEISRTEVIEKGINKLHSEISKKQK